jgi:hypothetical protein
LTYFNHGSLRYMSEVKAFLLRIRTAFAFGGRLKNALILSIAWNYFNLMMIDVAVTIEFQAPGRYVNNKPASIGYKVGSLHLLPGCLLLVLSCHGFQTQKTS